MADTSIITSALVHAMVRDWLETPINGYLGSNYGQDFNKYLHRPISTHEADVQLTKLRADVPVLQMLPDETLNLYVMHDQHERSELFIELAGHLIKIEDVSNAQ